MHVNTTNIVLLSLDEFSRTACTQCPCLSHLFIFCCGRRLRNTSTSFQTELWTFIFPAHCILGSVHQWSWWMVPWRLCPIQIPNVPLENFWWWQCPITSLGHGDYVPLLYWDMRQTMGYSSITYLLVYFYNDFVKQLATIIQLIVCHSYSAACTSMQK